jgi:hypothetical protein
MKVVKSICLDSDKAEWLKTRKEGASRWINDQIKAAMDLTGPVDLNQAIDEIKTEYKAKPVRTRFNLLDPELRKSIMVEAEARVKNENPEKRFISYNLSDGAYV